MAVLGIDPGLSGALTFLHSKIHLSIYDMPTRKIQVGQKTKYRIDVPELVLILKKHKTDIAVIEDVASMPSQGVVSTFNFGYGAGCIYGALIALGIPVIKIKPSVWKSAFNLSRCKKESLSLARKTFPKYEHSFKRNKDDGRAESALIALYYSKMFLR